MAKAIAQLAQATLFGLVYWKRDNNLRSATAYGSDKEISTLQDSLSHQGWVISYPALAYPVSDEDRMLGYDPKSGNEAPSKVMLDECLAMRKAEWEDLKERAKSDKKAAARLQVFQVLFTDGSGKLVVPKYLGNSGFRRSTLYFNAMVDRYLREKDEGVTEEDESPKAASSGVILPEVPIVVRSYQRKEDQIIEQQQENELQKVGVAAIPALNKLIITKRLFDLGCRQTKIRQLYRDSTGQKLFAICQANMFWPSLRIYDRLLLDKDNPDYLPWGPIRQEDLNSLCRRFEIQHKKESGKPLTDAEQKAFSPVSESDVWDYFNELKVKGKKANAPKVMARADVEAVAKQNPVKLVQECFGTVAENRDPATLAVYTEPENAKGLNLHTDLIKSGMGPVARKAMELAKDCPTIVLKAHDALFTDGKTVPTIVESFMDYIGKFRPPVKVPVATNNGSDKPSAVPVKS